MADNNQLAYTSPGDQPHDDHGRSLPYLLRILFVRRFQHHLPLHEYRHGVGLSRPGHFVCPQLLREHELVQTLSAGDGGRESNEAEFIN